MLLGPLLWCGIVTNPVFRPSSWHKRWIRITEWNFQLFTTSSLAHSNIQCTLRSWSAVSTVSTFSHGSLSFFWVFFFHKFSRTGMWPAWSPASAFTLFCFLRGKIHITSVLEWSVFLKNSPTSWRILSPTFTIIKTFSLRKWAGRMASRYALSPLSCLARVQILTQP